MESWQRNGERVPSTIIGGSSILRTSKNCYQAFSIIIQQTKNLYLSFETNEMTNFHDELVAEIVEVILLFPDSGPNPVGDCILNRSSSCIVINIPWGYFSRLMLWTGKFKFCFSTLSENHSGINFIFAIQPKFSPCSSW